MISDRPRAAAIYASEASVGELDSEVVGELTVMRCPLCACAHPRMTDAAWAVLNRPEVAVETPPQRHTPSTLYLSGKNEHRPKWQSRANWSENSGANPVSARVFWAARDVGDSDPITPIRASQSPSNGLVAGPCRQGGAVIPDSVTRYPIVNAIADPNHTPTTSWLARESGSGNQSPTGILTTSGV